MLCRFDFSDDLVGLFLRYCSPVQLGYPSPPVGLGSSGLDGLKIWDFSIRAFFKISHLTVKLYGVHVISTCKY